jgi:hypothetical protein
MSYLMPISRSIIRIIMPLTRDVRSTEERKPEDIPDVMADTTASTRTVGAGSGSAAATG